MSAGGKSIAIVMETRSDPGLPDRLGQAGRRKPGRLRLRLPQLALIALAPPVALIALSAPQAAKPVTHPGNQPIAASACIPAAELLHDENPLFASLRATFAELARQPISGAPVISAITGMTEGVRVCRARRLPGGALAVYQRDVRRIVVPEKGATSAIVAHEVFHFLQDRAGAYAGVEEDSKLTPRDGAVSLLLIEATAVAYALVVSKEAALETPGTRRKLPNPNGMARTFDRAFTATYANAAHRPEGERRLAALQAGGRAVVSALMAGQSGSWRRFYREQARIHLLFAPGNDGRGEAYGPLRDGIYARIGRVTEGLDLLPSEYIGTRAETAIASALREIDLAPANAS